MARPKKDLKPVPAPKRRSRGFQHASGLSRGAVQHVAGERGIAETDVLLRWAEIVGADLCDRCTPVKIAYPTKRALGASLIVQTDSGRAPEIEMRGPEIVERVNRFYGYKAVSRLKVTQSTGLLPPGLAEDPAVFQGKPVEPSPADTRKAEHLTSDIRSPGLREALARMGANVLAQNRGPDSETSA